MTNSSGVRVIPQNPDNCVAFGPTTSDRRTTDSRLSQLGAGFLTFDEDGSSEPWTLPYEEVLYVVSGTVRLVVGPASERPEEIVAVEGDVVVVPRGSTVRYGGDEGTRLFWSLVPQDWRTA